MRRVTTFLVLGILIGVAVGLLTPLSNFVGRTSKSKVASDIENLYQLANPGTSVKVMTVEEQDGMYKVLIKATDPTGANYREVYVSKNGKLLTESVIFVGESIKGIEKGKNFAACLNNKGLKIYGFSNQTATLMQFNILGRYSVNLYQSCDNELAQQCLDAGVTTVPSVTYGGNVYPGVQTIDWLENITQCKY